MRKQPTRDKKKYFISSWRIRNWGKKSCIIRTFSATIISEQRNFFKLQNMNVLTRRLETNSTARVPVWIVVYDAVDALSHHIRATPLLIVVVCVGPEMTPNPHLSVACGEYCVFRLGSSCNRIEFKSPAEKDLVGETVQRSSAAELLPGSTRDFFSPTRLVSWIVEIMAALFFTLVYFVNFAESFHGRGTFGTSFKHHKLSLIVDKRSTATAWIDTLRREIVLEMP